MMNPDTLDASIDTLRRKQPFHPFTLVMNDGAKLEVDHPKALTYYKGTGVFIGPGGAPEIFSSESVNRVIGDLAGQQSSA